MASDTLILNDKTKSILLSTRVFDNSDIISNGGENVGFPVTNTQDPQPRRRWVTDSQNPWFVVDLQQAPYNTNPLIDTIALLFHNAEIGSTFRVRTGISSSGTGSFDSGVLPMWPVDPLPPADDYRNPLAYQPQGAHTYFTVNDLKGAEDPSGFIWVNFPGGVGDFVTFGDVIDRPNGWVAFRFRNSGVPSSQMLMCKGVNDISVFQQGWCIGLLPNGNIVAIVGDGGGPTTQSVFGGDYTDNDWHTVVLFHDQTTGELILYVDGVEVDSVASGAGDSSNASPMEWGISASNIQQFTGDIERAIYVNFSATGQNGILSWINGWLAAEDPDQPPLIVPNTTVNAAWPITEAMGSILDRVGSKNGSLNGNVSWSQDEIPHLRDRYMRIDFSLAFETQSNFRMGRVAMGRSLQLLVPYPAGLPTPLGSPPKPQVSWPVRLTKQRWEQIGYNLMYDRGNSPETLESWGHDIHLIDGGKTVVAVNHILAEQPWQRHQGTVYGYISSLDEVSKERTGLVNGQLTVRGM